MMEFSRWMENRVHSVNAVRNQVATDRDDLGTAGFEGLQDIVDALKVVARTNPTNARALLSGMAGKLSAMLPNDEQNQDLLKRLRSGASRFVSASAKIGQHDGQQAQGEI